MPLTATTALAAISTPGGLTDGQVHDLLALLLDGGLAPAEGAALLAAWTARGETVGELTAVVRGLLARAVPVDLGGAPCFDLCGTGGSELNRFNISTLVSFILAAAGVPVAKIGNRGSRRPNGSFDLLDALGIPVQLTPEQIARIFRESGQCFLFARAVHPVVGRVAPMRKLVAGRTVFNLAGPLANPCRPRCQVIGVTHEDVAHVVAGALQRLGVEHAVVVRGHPGIDEVSVTGPSHLWELRDGHVHHRIAEHFHHHGLDHSVLPGGDAAHNVEIFHRLMRGEETGPLLDMVLANAAMALDCWRGARRPGAAETIAEVRHVLLRGSALSQYERHRNIARTVAGLSD